MDHVVLEPKPKTSRSVVPNRWVAEEWLWGREQQPQQFAKSRIFVTAHTNVKVHITSVIFPIWFLLSKSGQHAACEPLEALCTVSCEYFVSIVSIRV